MKLIAYLFTVSVLLSTMPDLPVLASPPSDQWVTGTGVLINKSGVILTNRHIVEGGCGELYAMDLQGQHSKGQVLRVSSRDDLALIQTERRDTMHVYLRVNDQHTHPIL